MEVVEAVRRRSLLERAELADAAAFTLQSVVHDYLSNHLAEEAANVRTRGHHGSNQWVSVNALD